MLTSKRQSKNVLSHWYVLMDNFQFSTKEFYDEIQKELAARQAPGLYISRVDFHEGGRFSDKRTYLRLARELFAFDVCAAPFGREFFFSLRFTVKPRPSIIPFVILAILLIYGGVYVFGMQINDLVVRRASPPPFIHYYLIGLVGLCVAFFLVGLIRAVGMNNTSQVDPKMRSRFPDFDTLLLNTPIFSDLYLRFRKDTYYRQDTRIMYHTLVSEIVKRKVEEVTSAKGVKLIRTYEYSPILGELYKKVDVKPVAEPAAT